MAILSRALDPGAAGVDRRCIHPVLTGQQTGESLLERGLDPLDLVSQVIHDSLDNIKFEARRITLLIDKIQRRKIEGRADLDRGTCRRQLHGSHRRLGRGRTGRRIGLSDRSAADADEHGGRHDECGHAQDPVVANRHRVLLLMSVIAGRGTSQSLGPPRHHGQATSSILLFTALLLPWSWAGRLGQTSRSAMRSVPHRPLIRPLPVRMADHQRDLARGEPRDVGRADPGRRTEGRRDADIRSHRTFAHKAPRPST